MMHKGTLLIFAYECYPYNRTGSAIGAQRPYQFAKNLSTLGWKVIVLCCDHNKRRTLEGNQTASVVDELYKSNQELLKQDGFCVIPLPSLKSYGVMDYLWSVSVIKGSGGSYVAKGFPYSIVRKVATFYNQLFHGDYSWSWTPVAKKFADKLVEEYKIDVIMGEHGPDAGILLANSFSKKYNIPWIADFRDPALRFLTGFFATLYKRVVQRIVSSASCTLTVSDYWSRLDEALFNKKSHVILNGYDQDLFEHTPTHEFSKFTVSYFGSFDQSYQDIIPSLQTFLHFLKENNYSSDIQLFYRGLAYKEFLQHAVDLDIPLTHLNVQGFCSREETATYMKGSQVLLIYSVASHKKNNVYEAQGVYPGKVFEYLGANQPILLIPSDHGIMEKLISSCKSGMATTSVNQANAFLQTKYNDWSLHIPAQCATSPDKAYSRRYQASQLDRILIDILGLQAE